MSKFYSKIKKIPLLFRVVFIITIIGTPALIWFNYYTKYQFKKDGATIKAEVTNIEITENEDIGLYGEKTGFTYRTISYKFKIDSIEYIGKSTTTPGVFYTISANDKLVLVEYIKSNPNKSRIKKSKELSLLTRF
jgi:hypothetical protein